MDASFEERQHKEGQKFHLFQECFNQRKKGTKILIQCMTQSLFSTI